MTTIAYDGQFLCTDSMMVGGHIRMGAIQKLFVLEDGPYLAVAFCGASGNVMAFLDWLKGGERPSISDEFSIGAIAIGRDGEAYQFDSEVLGRVAIASPEACGSGAPYAMGAMLAGASAHKAVEVASRLDTNSGGPIQCFNINARVLTGPFGSEMVEN